VDKEGFGIWILACVQSNELVRIPVVGQFLSRAFNGGAHSKLGPFFFGASGRYQSVGVLDREGEGLLESAMSYCVVGICDLDSRGGALTVLEERCSVLPSSQY